MSISSTAVNLSGHVGHKVSVSVTDSAMSKTDAMGKPNAMGKPDAMAKPDAMSKPDAMAKPGAMAAPTPAMTVSSLRMIAATCGM